jgi:hypothetical protein
MAWAEKSGHGTWRVRFRRDDDTIGSVNGFATKLNRPGFSGGSVLPLA